MHKIIFFLTLLFVALFNLNTTAQNAGDNDPTFNPSDVGFGFGDGAFGTIYTSSIQNDGKIIVGGNFNYYNNIFVNNIIRLNIDGTLDSNFIVGLGANSTVLASVVQPDGKILVGGNFTSFNGSNFNRIVRLNSNGSIDMTFSIGAGFNGSIHSIKLQPDGKILVGGEFTYINGMLNRFLARLNTNGSVDNTFNNSNGVNHYVYSISLQNDGKIIIGGTFFTCQGISRNSIARLDSDGSLDTNFIVGLGTDMAIKTTEIQNDGKILIGGWFSSYNGFTQNGITRLNANGTLDTTFTIGFGISANGGTPGVLTIGLQTDGKILIGGWFSSYNGLTQNGITRLNTNGTLDTLFNDGLSGANYIVNTIKLQADDKAIVGGVFNSYNSIAKQGIVRIETNGLIDGSFNHGTGISIGGIYTAEVQQDEKIIIGGSFLSYNDVSKNHVARLNSNGDLDTSFIQGVGTDDDVYAIVLQPDNKIIIGGSFSQFNGEVKNRIVRLFANGSLDTTFNIGSGADSTIKTIALQQDGKILIGGDFSNYNGTTLNGIARLNMNGTVDNSFIIGTGTNNTVQQVVVQSDGKIIIAGNFTDYNGTPIGRIGRIDTNGVLDITFNVSTGANGAIYALKIQPDGMILIGGDFTTYKGSVKSHIARIKTNGILDPAFTIGSGLDNYVSSISLQSDGKIIVGGNFNNYNSFSCGRLIRLNTNGTIDPVLNTGLGVDGSITVTKLQADGKIIIGGHFVSYNGIGRNRIARILNCGVTASYSSIDNGTGNYSFTNISSGSYNKMHWAFGDGTTSTAANPNHTFSANGTYVVVLTVNDSTNSSCIDYYLDTIVVTGVVVPLQCAAGFVMYPVAGNVTVINSSTGSNLTYLWDFGDGSTSTQQFPTHTYTASDNYYLCLTVDDGAGCVNMYCDSIGENGVVFNKQTGFNINVIAPPLATQVNEQTILTSSVVIYPNPTLKEFVVELKEDYSQVNISIFNVNGKILYNNSNISNSQFVINIENWNKGLYIIKITGSSKNEIIRLVKQ